MSPYGQEKKRKEEEIGLDEGSGGKTDEKWRRRTARRAVFTAAVLM